MRLNRAYIGIILSLGLTACDQPGELRDGPDAMQNASEELVPELEANIEPDQQQNASKQFSDTTNNDRFDPNRYSEGGKKIAVNTNRDSFTIQLFPKFAPLNVARIEELVASGFYDGREFFRKVDNLFIQTGCPYNTGFGGTGISIAAEFNEIPNYEGTVGMARASEPDSADSQFYIALSRAPVLDGNFTVVGHVIEGLEVVKSLQVGDEMIEVKIVEQ